MRQPGSSVGHLLHVLPLFSFCILYKYYQKTISRTTKRILCLHLAHCVHLGLDTIICKPQNSILFILWHRCVWILQIIIEAGYKLHQYYIYRAQENEIQVFGFLSFRLRLSLQVFLSRSTWHDKTRQLSGKVLDIKQCIWLKGAFSSGQIAQPCD